MPLICRGRLQWQGTPRLAGNAPIFQGSYSPFEKTMLDAEDQSMPPREITAQSASPLIPKFFLQSAWIFASSYSPAP